jgi:hypothetical protein
MIKNVVITACLAVGVSQAMAISKCKGPGGAVVFQDAPCTGQGGEITVKPASGSVAPAAVTTQAKTQASLDTLKGERIRKEKWLVMNGARNALDAQRRQCADIQKQLAASKGWSNNNLAGAVRDVSISQEMTASAVACDSGARAKEKEVAEAEKVCQEIKCIAVF